MEKEVVERRARNNISLYKKYKMFAYDFLFYYAISVLFCTITKGFSMSQVMYLESFFAIFSIVFYLLGNKIVNKLNLKLSAVIGNFFLIICVIMYIFCNSFKMFIIADLFCAFGFTLKNIAESSILYSSLRKIGKRSEFSKIEGRANSKYYYFDAFASLISGFLFVFNNYIPVILCGINLCISFFISLKFTNVDKQDKNEDYTIKDMINETKSIFSSNRLKALYLFSFIFTGIVAVSAVLYKAIILDVGIKEQYSTMVICIMSIFIGIGAKTFFHVEKMTKSKTLKFFSINYVLSMGIVGVMGIFKKLDIFTMSAILIALSLMGYIQGAYRVALKKYALSFTTHEIRNRITSTYYIFENIGKAVLTFLIGFLLNYTSNSIACIIFSAISFIIMLFVLYYMRGRLGLKPEQYAPEDINNMKV